MNQSTKRSLSSKNSALTRHLEPPRSVRSTNIEDEKNKQELTIRDRGRQCKGPTRDFSKLIFRGEVYTIGDYVLIRETEKTDMVAKLTKIYPEGVAEKHVMIQVKWYFKKDDLESNSLPLLERINLGDNEVFDTNTETKIYADLLNKKCTVWKLEEYEGKSGLGVNDYYTRASYDIRKVLALC